MSRIDFARHGTGDRDWGVELLRAVMSVERGSGAKRCEGVGDEVEERAEDEASAGEMLGRDVVRLARLATAIHMGVRVEEGRS